MKKFNSYQAKKHFGQNFLINKNIIYKIIDYIEPSQKYNIFEIGPGLGALTQTLIQKCLSLNAIEYDKEIIPILLQNCQDLGELIVHNQDVLSFNFENAYKETNKKLIIAGNLPYNISSPILFHLYQYSNIIKHMVFMLQKEVVERICATPGTKQYGRLSVMLQYRFKTIPLITVPSTAFKPQPKVTSQVVKLVPHSNIEVPALDLNHFSLLVKTAFSQRRKTLKNNLKNFTNITTIEKIGINPLSRAETLSVNQFIKLSNAIITANKS